MSYRFARRLSCAALVVAASALLAACGSDDSTATSTPSLPTSAPATSAPATSNPSPSSSAAVTSPGPAATAPPEQPQPVPSGFPGPTETPQAGSKEQRFLDELRKQGINPSGQGENALSIASYVCQGIQQGGSDADLTPFVNAMAGVEENSTGGTKSPEDAGKIYIDTAKSTYCQ